MDKFIGNHSTKPILPDGYETERLLNGFRKGGDKHRPFQGKSPTVDDAILTAIEHSKRPTLSDNE